MVVLQYQHKKDIDMNKKQIIDGKTLIKQEQERINYFNGKNKLKISEFYSNLNPNYFKLENFIVKLNPTFEICEKVKKEIYQNLTEIFKLFNQQQFNEMTNNIKILNLKIEQFINKNFDTFLNENF